MRARRYRKTKVEILVELRVVVIARIVAGAAGMPYRSFVLFNVVGGLAWVGSMILTGYFLGNLLKSRFGIDLEEHIEWVVIVVVLLSLVPPFVEYFKSRREKMRAANVA